MKINGCQGQLNWVRAPVVVGCRSVEGNNGMICIDDHSTIKVYALEINLSDDLMRGMMDLSDISPIQGIRYTGTIGGRNQSKIGGCHDNGSARISGIWRSRYDQGGAVGSAACLTRTGRKTAAIKRRARRSCCRGRGR